MGDEPLIRDSARRHGIVDADIRHALRLEMVAVDVDQELDDNARRSIHIGPGRTGALLEIVVIELNDGSEIVIHAMKLRRSYERYLPGRGDR